MNFRPSLLPKLAACPKYQSEESAGPAAERGTMLDVAFRLEITGVLVDHDPAMNEDDAAAVAWAVDTARVLAGDHPLEASEDALRIHAEGMDGTADLLCEGGQWSADLKTGQVRNYEEQQAVYALGFMDLTYTDEWTVYLIYCDQRELQSIRYTRESAEKIVRDVKAKALDDLAVATPCDYCGWCARRWRCPERLETVAWFLGLDPRTVDLAQHAESDPVKCAQALNLTHEIQKDDGVHDFLKAKGKEHIDAGRPLPGWKVQAGRATKSVPALMLQHPFRGKTLLGQAGTAACMAECKALSVDGFTKLWKTAFGEDPIPAGTVIENHGSPYLMKDRAKKAKA